MCNKESSKPTLVANQTSTVPSLLLNRMQIKVLIYDIVQLCGPSDCTLCALAMQKNDALIASRPLSKYAKMITLSKCLDQTIEIEKICC